MWGAACPDQRLDCVGKGLFPMHVFPLTALDRKDKGTDSFHAMWSHRNQNPSSVFPATRLPTASCDRSDVALLSPAGDCSPWGQLFLVEAYRLSGLHFLGNPPPYWLKLSRLKPRRCSLVILVLVTCTLFVSVKSGCTVWPGEEHKR